MDAREVDHGGSRKIDMASSKKKYSLILSLIVVFGVGCWISLRWLNHKDDHTISLSGNIELTEVNISFKVPGKLVELNVDEGSEVKKEMVVARLDQEQLLHQRERARAALISAQSQLTMLHTDIDYQKQSIQEQIEQRQAELRQAEANLRDLQAGSRVQEIKQAGASVDEARIEYERANKDWGRAQTLRETGDISAAQFEQNKTRYETAAAALKAEEERMGMVVEGPRKETIEAARAAVARAQAALKLADTEWLGLKMKEQEVETRSAEIARARADVALIESQLEDPVAFSSIDGVVLAKAAEVGEVLAAGTTVVTIGDLDHPWLRGYINEQELGLVKLGTKVKVTTDSFPGKAYWGRVSFISSKAEFTPKQIQTPEERVKLVYRIKIEIANPEHELKSNMPADALILLGEMLPVQINLHE